MSASPPNDSKDPERRPAAAARPLDPSPPARESRHGKGTAILRANGSEAMFTNLSYTYPLKILSPQASSSIPVGIAYVVSYGGGLVSGDRIDLEVDVGEGAYFVLLTQGSTKVFKSRSLFHASTASLSKLVAGAPSTPTTATPTTQLLSAKISSGGLLLLLPDPVTPFHSASYTQHQTFHLQTGASAIILDWFTSGRMSRGEEWDFDHYRSTNEVWVEGKRIARDVMLLENVRDTDKTGFAQSRSLKERLAPYVCYATLLLFGPLVEKTVTSLQAIHQLESQMQARKPSSFIWSLSALEDQPDKGVIVRAAGKTTEVVRIWLKDSLKDMVDVVGYDAYDKVLI